MNNFDTKAILKNIGNQLQEELQAKAEANSHQLQAEADAYFQDSNEQQTSQFYTAPPVGPFTKTPTSYRTTTSCKTS